MCYVYHYTKTDGFKGIVESRELWATSIYHLNDPTEFEYGRNAFIESVKALLKDREATDGAVQLLSYLFDEHPPLFVCSFSAAEDDLYQWKAYSAPYGCAIGFPVDTLLTYAGMLRFDLVRCQYGTAGMQEAAEGTVKIIGEILKMAGGIKGFRSQFRFNDPLSRLIMKSVARYKNEKLAAEQEVRLIHFPEIYEHPRHRMSGDMQVSYLALSLKNDESWTKAHIERLWKQAKIVVSPRSPEKARHERESVAAFLESELRKHSLPTDCATSIRLSQVPYRPTLSE